MAELPIICIDRSFAYFCRTWNQKHSAIKLSSAQWVLRRIHCLSGSYFQGPPGTWERGLFAGRKPVELGQFIQTALICWNRPNLMRSPYLSLKSKLLIAAFSWSTLHKLIFSLQTLHLSVLDLDELREDLPTCSSWPNFQRLVLRQHLSQSWLFHCCPKLTWQLLQLAFEIHRWLQLVAVFLPTVLVWF